MNKSTAQQGFPWKGVLIGCGSIGLIGLLLFCAGFIWLLSGPESGVRLSNEMDEYATEYLKEHKVLNDSEELIAYYDVTISMDGTEAAILTTERVIYHKNGTSTSIPLTEITDIRHRQDSLIGDIIEIDSQSGMPMKIEISLFNQGETFLNLLVNAWEKNRVEPEEGIEELRPEDSVIEEIDIDEIEPEKFEEVP